jgi:DNA-binding response OmpR family regulator
MAEKILIVEDETQIARTVRLYLEQAGYGVATVFDGDLTMPAFCRERPDLVILDLLLPNVAGWELCQFMRHESAVPIIMLTAQQTEIDRIVGLELGADDYITKPCSPREVVARVRAVLLRAQGQVRTGEVLQAGEIVVDLTCHSVRIAGQPLELTPIEFELLSVLVSHPGRVFTRLHLLDQVQGQAYEGFERAIDQHVKNLRTKLGDEARNPRYIATVYGVGNKFVGEEASDA